MEGKDPQVEASNTYVREKEHCVSVRKGRHEWQSLKYYVSGGCLLSLSMCRRGFQDLLKVRPSSLFMLCGCFPWLPFLTLMNDS